MFEFSPALSKSLLAEYPGVDKAHGSLQTLRLRKKSLHHKLPKRIHNHVKVAKQDYSFGTANHPSDSPHRLLHAIPNNIVDFKDDAIRIEAWGNKHFETWMQSLTAKEVDILKNYTSAQFFNLNCYLRGKKLLSRKDPSIKYDALAKELSSILSRAAIPSDLIVYRGISNQQILDLLKRLEVKDPKLLPGKILVDKAYMSTTLNEKVGAKFSNNKQSDYLLRIMVPAGTPGAYMGNLSTYQYEAEILLEKGQILRIQGMQQVQYSHGSLCVLDCVLLGTIHTLKKNRDG